VCDQLCSRCGGRTIDATVKHKIETCYSALWEARLQISAHHRCAWLHASRHSNGVDAV